MKVRGKKVRCDVCEKIIKTKKFRHIIIHVANYEDVYVQEAMCASEKVMDVCNSCVLNLNFRPFKQDKKIG